jgi:peroxiredoxin
MQSLLLHLIKKNYIFLAVILALTVFSSNSFAQEGKEADVAFLQSGSLAPINSLKAITNEEVSFPVPNKWNLVFYWSLFCHSCIEEMPEIQEGLSKLNGKEFETFFVSLDTEKMQKALENFKRRRKFPAPILMEKVENEKYLSADSWGVTMTPSVFIVDPQGKIIYSHQGPLDLDLFFKNLPEELVGKPVVESTSSEEESGVIIDEQ